MTTQYIQYPKPDTAAATAITALTGDGTATGPGSAPLTLATVNASPGLIGDSSHALIINVNGKGLVFQAASTLIQIAESQVTNLVSDLAGKQATLTPGNISTSTTGVSIGSGTSATVGPAVTVNVQTASGSQPGLLSAADWTTFNGKQASGNYITSLTGDVTASGAGAAAATLSTVNGNVGSFGSASSVSTFTVNAKGLLTAAASTSIVIAESQVTNLVSDLALKAPLASPTFTGTGTFNGNVLAGVATGTTSSMAIGAVAQAIDGASLLNFVNSSTTTNWQIGSNIISGGALTFTPSTAGGGSTFNVASMTLGSANSATFSGQVVLSTAGKGISIKEGSNAKMGVATLSGGVTVVSTTAVTASSRIFISVQSLGTVTVATPIAVTARSAGTSFTISSSNVIDTSVVAWTIFEPS